MAALGSETGTEGPRKRPVCVRGREREQSSEAVKEPFHVLVGWWVTRCKAGPGALVPVSYLPHWGGSLGL